MGVRSMGSHSFVRSCYTFLHSLSHVFSAGEEDVVLRWCGHGVTRNEDEGKEVSLGGGLR